MKCKIMILKGAPTGAPFLKVLFANTFLLRLRGLMGRKRLPEFTGLLLVPCDSVHMCFMRFSIDVVYLDKDLTILKIVKNLKPWIGLSMCHGAWATLELNAGEAGRFDLEIGRQLVLGHEPPVGSGRETV